MTVFTPPTAELLDDSLIELPSLTAPTAHKLASLERLMGEHLSSCRATVCHSNAQYKAFQRLFANKRLSVAELAYLQCDNLYQRCARRCEGRDVVAICDTCEFALANLRARTTPTDAARLGVLSDGATAGLKAHCVVCFERRTGRPLGIAHVLVYASPAKADDAPGAPGAVPLAERQSARWVDSIHAALRHSVHTARRVTFVADAEADQYTMLAGVFADAGAADAGAADAGGPEVRWCIRLAHDRVVRDEALGYWSKAQLTIAAHLRQRCPPEHERCVRLTLAASGSRHEREVDVRVRSAAVQLRRPPGSGLTSRPTHYRGRAIPDVAPCYVTAVEQVDARGETYGRMSGKARERYHRDPANRRRSAPIHWVLATSFPVATAAEQRGVMALYGRRWLIELYFRMLKSDGLDVERSAARRVGRWVVVLLLGMDGALTAEELVAMRDGDARPGGDKFTAAQMRVLEADDYARCHPGGDKAGRVYVSSNEQAGGTVSWYAVQVAIMAGYMGGKDSPPGRKLMARGLQRLAIKVEALRDQARFEQKGKSVP